ncbi:MAG: VirB4 family type IV secretion system protein, partial [Vulcanimicrobiaceae bacterium]
MIGPPIVCTVFALAAIAAVVLAPELMDGRRELMRTERQRFLRHAFADYLPYRRLVRRDVVANASGSYLAAWRIAGADVGTITDREILDAAYHVAATIGNLPVGTIVQLYARRRRVREYDRGHGLDHPVLALLDDLRADFFLRRERVYHTERTLTITWQPPSDRAETMRAAASVGLDAARRTEDAVIAEFDSLCESLESTLSTRTITMRRLGEAPNPTGDDRVRSELLGFLSTCVSGTEGPLVVPPPAVDLNELLAVEVRGGYEVRIGDFEVSAVHLKSYPDDAVPRLLDKLTELKVPHLLQMRYIPTSVAKARTELRGAAVDFRGAARFTSGVVDPDALKSAEQMVTAYGAAAGDYTRFGRTSFVLIVRARDRAAVRKAERAVIGVLEGAGFLASVRRMAALDTILSTLPGEGRYGLRAHPLDALTVAKLFPLHESAAGRRWSESEALPPNVPALTYALGPGHTFYRMHLNVRDVWAAIVIGKTGAGKSVLASYLAAMYRGRLPLAGVTTIDRGRSSYQMCRMLDGNYYDLLGHHSPGFALFSDVEDPDQAREVLQIIEEMCELSGVRVTPERHESLETAVRLMATIAPQRRSLYAFWEQLQDPDRTLRPALRKYTRLGELGTMLDCSEDSFQTGRFNVVDIERVVGMSQEYLIPIYRTLFWKSRSQVRRLKTAIGPRGDALHWLFNVDEAHTLLSHPLGAQFILETHKMGRKENFGLWLSSNALAEFVQAPNRNDILLASQTRIYFGDAGATYDDPYTVDLYRQMQLPTRGIAMVANLPDRSFVLHQPDAGVLRELNLRLDQDVLAVVGTSRTIARVDEYMDRYPEGSLWKVEMLRATGATNAADRLERILEDWHEPAGTNTLTARAPSWTADRGP